MQNITICYLLGLFLAIIAAVEFATSERMPRPAVSRFPIETAPAPDSSEPLTIIPQPPALDQARVELGRRLFSEKMLSHNGDVSCASCHDLAHGGADKQAFSRGVAGAKGVVNAPTVYNSALNFRQFWDGRAATLEDQIDGPIHNPLEMASSWPEVIVRLKGDPAYVAAFASIYPEGIDPAAVRNAIATFERTLLAPGSRFDRYLGGDKNALSAHEQEGYRLFKSYGCASCHQGANVGGNMFQRFGVMGDYFNDRGQQTTADLGRYNVTGLSADRHVFRVPSLRLAVLTAPYFHDGSAKTLREAIDVMAKYQLGREIPEVDNHRIITFLASLPGDLPEKVEHAHP